MKKSLAVLAALTLAVSASAVAPIGTANAEFDFTNSKAFSIVSGHKNEEIPYDNSAFLKSSEYIDPSESEIKPTLTVDKLEVEASEAPGSVQTVKLNVNGAEGKYSSVGLHIFYDDRMTVKPIIERSRDVYVKSELSDFILDSSSQIDEGVLFFTAMGMDNDGIDGAIATMQFRLPEDAKAGDLYPIGLEYYTDYKTMDVFGDVPTTKKGKLMMSYLFTQGIENGYIKVVGEDIEPTTGEVPTGELVPELKGDANLDKDVNIADAVLVMQVATNPDKYAQGKSDVSIKPQGEINADVDGKKGLTNSDALLIQKFKLGLVESL